MRKVYKAGLLKVFLLVIFYFLDVAISSSGNYQMEKVLRSEQVMPVAQNITNEHSGLEEFDYLESRISFLLNRFEMKGASVAVARDGRLVYAKGVGYADLESDEHVEPYHLLRVASISKLLTAITIIKMRELNLVDLDDKVFGPEGILNDSIYLDYTDARSENITVRHLLNHSAGWNSRFGDHLFMPHVIGREMNIDLPVDISDIIRFALKKRLHYTPGTRTSYSNLGYAILGEVVAKVSGMEYEDYVKQSILHPVGIYGMRIGGNLKSDRFENEVSYYEQSNAIKVNAYYDIEKFVPMSYGGNDVKTLGAAGGWIATPAELLRLVSAMDGSDGSPGILSPRSIELMTNKRLSGGRTIGWTATDSRGNWWRTGTFAGTSALLMRRGNGLSYAVIFNSSTYRGTTLSREIIREVQTALNRVNDWPEHDLFYQNYAPVSPHPDIAGN